MIVDTSALVAIHQAEPAHERLRQTLRSESAIIPSPVIVEFERVTALEFNAPDFDARRLVAGLLERHTSIAPFT